MGLTRIRLFESTIARELPEMIEEDLHKVAKMIAAHIRSNGTSHVTGHVIVDGTTIRNRYAGALSIEFGTAKNPPYADHRRAVQAVTGKRMEDR